MSSSLSDFRDLGRRMDLLEKQNRRLRAALVLATILGGAVILAQQVPVSLAQAERDNSEKDRLTLKDKDGNHRAWLGMGTDGAPGLFFADPKQKSSAVMTFVRSSTGTKTDAFRYGVVSQTKPTELASETCAGGSTAPEPQ